jgi:hypothetical protein
MWVKRIKRVKKSQRPFCFSLRDLLKRQSTSIQSQKTLMSKITGVSMG